jgi:hypothetical protein
MLPMLLKLLANFLGSISDSNSLEKESCSSFRAPAIYKHREYLVIYACRDTNTRGIPLSRTEVLVITDRLLEDYTTTCSRTMLDQATGRQCCFEHVKKSSTDSESI